MKQLWQSISTGEAVVVDVPAPRPGKGKILVRVRASLISAGTERTVVEFAAKNLLQKAMARPDLTRQLVDKAKREGWIPAIQAARNRLDSDMVLGYSNSGIVIDVGEGITEFKRGDRVACAGGGFATHSEFVQIPRNLAAVIPDGHGFPEVSWEEAAFATVAAIGLQGVRLAQLQLGEVVAVIGLGLIGQIVVQLARANGCTVIGIDPSVDRCRLAERLAGIETASSDEEMKVLTLRASNSHGADSVLIAAATGSNGPVTLAAEIARDRATVVAVGAVGMALPRKPYYEKELDFRVSRSYGPGRYDAGYENKGNDYPIGYVRWTEGRNLGSILQLLASRKLDCSSLISHRFPIEKAVKGYELISGKTGEPFLGVVITYPSDSETAHRVDLPNASAHSAKGSGPLCVGVLGAGNFTTATLLPAMRAAGGVEFAGICAAGGTSARSAAGRFGFRFCTTNESDLLLDPSINTIVIATRHGSHGTQVAAALEAGKHVFCEKPLAMNQDQLAAIVDVYDRRDPNQLLLVGYNRRFAPLARRLKAFVSELTEPFVMHYRVNAGLIPADHWTQDPDEGGGRILGEVCHFVDFLSFLCGEAVTSVSTVLTPNAGRYMNDNLAAILRFAGGSIGTITYTANGDKSFSKERVEVFVQGRAAVLEDYRELRTVSGGKHRVTRSRLRVDKGHRDQWKTFTRLIREGGPSPISFEEILNSTLATFALCRSSLRGSWEDVSTDRFLAHVRGGLAATEFVKENR